MPRRFIVLFIATLLLAEGSVRADGLVFQLPPDGTWARYVDKGEAEFEVNGKPRKLSTERAVTVSSVGELTRNGQKCRWIELQIENNARQKGVYPRLLLKLLVPQDYMRRGEDPLAHPVLTFFDPKPVDRRAPLVESFIDEGFNRIQYEIDRFRTIFPRPLDNTRQLKPETVETPAGKFENCEVVVGTSRLDGQTLNDGRMASQATYRLFLHPQAPFGIVAMHIEAKATEYAKRGPLSILLNETVTLSGTGRNAISQLHEQVNR